MGKRKYVPGKKITDLAEFMVNHIKKRGVYHHHKYQGPVWVAHWTIRFIEQQIKFGAFRTAEPYGHDEVHK